MSGSRLDAGGRVDRARPLRFRFDGKSLEGFAGDTLASALLANGMRTVARSFKLHRRRGIFGAGAEEPNALVQIGEGADATPNLKATQVELFDGLVASSVNRWPTLDWDAGALAGWFSRFLPAGFYYKTFKWPTWRVYEPLVRRAAGFGRAPDREDPDRYTQRHAHCDVLIAGAGPAGLSAALAASRRGARVILCDSDWLLGGSLMHCPAEIDGEPATRWVDHTDRELATFARVRVLRRTSVAALYDHNLAAAVENIPRLAAESPSRDPVQRLWIIRARQIVLATGALERPLPFENNDLPGVMLASAVCRYIRRFAVAPGRRLLVFTNNDEGYRAADAALAAGIEVAAIIDPRDRATAARSGNGLVRHRALVRRAIGRTELRGAEIEEIDGGGRVRVACDLLAVSGGWNPAIQLSSQRGATARFDSAQACFVSAAQRADERSAGAAAGAFGLAEALAQGWNAGLAAVEAAGGRTGDAGSAPRAAPAARQPILPLWQAQGRPERCWIDLQNDVTAADVALAARENYRSVEHMKRYTTAGLAPDQGKTGNPTASALLGVFTGRTPDAVGLTRFRPPYDPVTIGTMAGTARAEHLRPILRLPAHGRHVAAGAAFEEFSGWLRPTAYPRAGEPVDDAIARESRAVRSSVGLFDASPLGKIDVRGPDAAAFLERMFVQAIGTITEGRLRYVMMLNEQGAVIDDGVVARLAGDRFLVGTSSAGASRTAEIFEEWLQGEWPHMRVFVTALTHQWSTLTLAGPRARAVLERVSDLAQPFPPMTLRQASVAGLPARIARISFTGETSFEISVAARQSEAVWNSLLEAGAGEAIAPFGIEALMTLRIEKGFVHVGSETDGTTTPVDLGIPFERLKTADFIGRRSLRLPALRQPDRRQLVGILPDDPAHVPRPGAHVASADRAGSAGWVTSACLSPVLERGIALAVVSSGRRRMGESVTLIDEGRWARARIVAPCFFDPEGKRLDV
jgi:sarcosine oxidase subunit alpha